MGIDPSEVDPRYSADTSDKGATKGSNGDGSIDDLLKSMVDDMASIDQLERALRNADAAGDTNAAKAFANEIRRIRSEQAPTNDGTVGPTLARGGTALPDPRNDDGTYGKPPEGMVFNPKTGQMEDLGSPINLNIPTGRAAAIGIGAGQGAGFGLLDEATAALSVPFGGDYDYNLGVMREAEKRAASDHPGAYYSGMIGGGIGTGVGLAKGGVSLTANAMNAGKGLNRVAGASALEGALLGAAQGFGNGEGNFDDRAVSALKSGGLGLALGGAAPYAIAGVSAASKPIVAP